MLGIPDPQIWIAYVLCIACVIFSVWYGIRFWNEEDDENGDVSVFPHKKKNVNNDKE